MIRAPSIVYRLSDKLYLSDSYPSLILVSPLTRDKICNIIVSYNTTVFIGAIQMIQSVEKAFRLLNAVATDGEWIGVRELSRITGMNPPTAQQLLKTLQEMNFLEFDPENRKYRIGMASILLGRSVDTTRRLADFSKPHVDEIFDEFGETTVALCVERGCFRPLYCKQCAKQLATAVPSEEDIMNPHLMACGQILLAWQEESFLETYITQRQLNNQFITLMKKVKNAGFSELIDYNGSGVAAYGVPVFDSTQKVFMSIGWSIPLTRFGNEIRDKVLPRLLKISKDMSDSLNFNSKRN